MNSTPRLILASNSPRRQELLRNAGFRFEVFTRDFEENFPDTLAPAEVAEYLAKQKNENYRKLLGNETVITSDTTVVLDESVLNKPLNRQNAFVMLKSLSAKTHLVISGVCISSPEKVISFSDTTEVTFFPLSDDEINYYIDNYKPFDKAGAYGIQEWIGLTKVKELKGSFYNVMGLPVSEVYRVLKEEFDLHPSIDSPGLI